jgi:hypothetical protein
MWARVTSGTTATQARRARDYGWSQCHVGPAAQWAPESGSGLSEKVTWGKGNGLVFQDSGPRGE